MVPPVSHRVSRVRRYSGNRLIGICFRLRDSHPLWLAFPYHSANISDRCDAPQPRSYCYNRFGLFRVRSPLLAESHFDFSSSPYLDVSVQAVPLIYLCIQYMMTGHDSGRIAPFGYLWINACLRLPIAYRSLLRPSSAPSAKAFPLRSL